MAERRPIESEMQLLWARLENVCATVDTLVAALVGSRRGFTLLIHPLDPAHATLSVTNTMSNLGAVREWVRHMDARTAEGRLSDEVIEATYGTREKYIEVCEANLAARERETFKDYLGQLVPGMAKLSQKKWQALHVEQLATLRANIAANGFDPPARAEKGAG